MKALYLFFVDLMDINSIIFLLKDFSAKLFDFILFKSFKTLKILVFHLLKGCYKFYIKYKNDDYGLKFKLF